MKNPAIIVVSSVFLLATAAGAQEVIEPADGVNAILRDSPPGMLLGTEQGRATGRFVVIQGRRVPVFFGYERWLRVVPLDQDNMPEEAGPYWVFWGKVGGGVNDFVSVDPCDGMEVEACGELRERLSETISAFSAEF